MSMLLRRGLWREVQLLRKCHTNPSFSPLQKRLLLPVIAAHSIPSSSSSSSLAFFSSAVEVENHVSEETETAQKLENHVPEERGTAHELNEEEKQGIADKAEKCEGLIANNLEDEVRTLRAELEDQKALIKSLIQDVNLLKSSPNGGKPMVSKARLPEWTTFLEHLKNSEFLKDERKGGSKKSLFDDAASVKRALYKFSQVHESIYESLPQNDIKIVAQNGLVDDDQKAQASLKRLRKHYELDTQEEDNVSDLPSIQPKLLDVLRLLYSTLMLSQLDALAEGVKSSVAVLLKEIIKLSGTKKAKSKVSDAEKVKAILNKDKEMKTMAESDAKSEQWECPRCHFKNLDHKYRCVECSRKRPMKTYLAPEGKEDTNLTTDALDEQLDVKLPLGGKAKTHRKEGSNISSLSDQENNDQETSVKTGALRDDDDDVSQSDIDILDDILDDSDDSEEEKESGKKSSLSDLFNKKKSPGPTKKREDRNDRGQNSSTRLSVRGKANGDDDSDNEDDSEDEPRARRGGSRSFLDEDSDDEDSRRPRSASRGFGDSSSRRTDKWDRNSNRQSGTRGGGDSYDERRGGSGGWRGGGRGSGRGGGRGGGGDRFGSDRFGGGGDRRDRNEDSYEERGSRFGGGGGGGRSRGRGRSTRY